MSSSPRFHDLEICRVRKLTDNSVAVQFEIPGSLKNAYSFIPGQYLTLRSTINGHDIRRPYSICSVINSQHLEVGIRHVDDGLFSSFAQNLHPGDKLSVMTPQGQFKVPNSGPHNYLLIAAGSGITPILSILANVLVNEPDSQLTLVYSNQTSATIMFRDDIDALKDQFTSRFSLIHLLSQQEHDVPLFNGRLDSDKLLLLTNCGLISPKQMDGIFICGPGAMIETCKTTFQEMGVKPERIHFELFTPTEPPAGSVKPVRKPVAQLPRGTMVEAVIDGICKKFNVDGSTQTVLEAARSDGIDLPFSCTGGMCCTCRCKVVSGECEMDVHYSLQDWEIEAGFVLACQSRPTSDKLVLDFDAS